MSLYDIPLKSLTGEPVSLADYRDRAVLVVNVASKCGLTPSTRAWRSCRRSTGTAASPCSACPATSSCGQEPGSAEEIRTFCSTTYGVSFPLLEKLDVNGDARHPLYTELVKVADAEGEAGDVQWNFEKFLIGRDGRVTRFRPRTEPDAPEVVSAIEAQLV